MKKIICCLIIFQNIFCLSQTIDANGKKQGYWKKKDEKTNKLIYEGTFLNNIPNGKFKYYHPNDSIKAIMIFSNNGEISYSELFNSNGKKMAKGKYYKELKDSIWIYYDDSGLLISKENYIKGKKEGGSFVYLPDGSISEEKNYKQDIQHGEFKQYFDGKNLKSKGNYINGALNGKTCYYYPNGIEVAEGFYSKGQKTGIWVYKDEKGKITEKELYQNNKLCSKKVMEDFLAKNKLNNEKQKEEINKTESKKIESKQKR